ncbi:MAG: gluconokinase [Bacteroidota bacterium]|nr:gluconokinase [Bacteroidota bacterium]
MHCVIGIDIGTGSTKAVAVNDSEGVFCSVQKPYATTHTREGYNEQDLETIWQAVVHCIKELLPKLETHSTTIAFSSAMHSLVAVDNKGVPLTPLIIWSDTRSASIAESLKNSAEGEAFYTATGTPVHAMSPLCKIKWLKENSPAVFRQTAKFISIKEYIWWKLFGVYEIDYSIASATGLFAIENLGWYKKALSWAGITVSQLSQPVNTVHARQQIAPHIASLLNLTTNTTFIIGASDGCLANIGSFALQPGIAAITIGSSGAVRVFSKVPILHFPSMPFSYRLDSESYICGGPINNGGIVIQWLLKNFLMIDVPDVTDYDSLFEKIKTIKAGCEGLLFLPYLTGERAPVWDAKSCGTFFGLGMHHTAAHMIRAAVEGVCFAIYDTLQMMEDSTTPVKQLQVSGGFTQSTAWLQMIADVTGKKLNLVQTEDASAIGAAYLALQTLGIRYTTSQQTIAIKPRMDHHRIYQQNFSIYKSLYPSLKEAMHKLYQLNH